MSFYLADVSIMLRNDCLPLKRFLQKTTLNTKVYNWNAELSNYNIKFEFIKG